MSISHKCGAGRPPSMDAGPLAGPIAAYEAELSGLGYTSLTIRGCVDSARHLAAWLAISDVAVSALDERVLERFARHRCHCGGNRRLDWLSSKYVNRARRFARFLSTFGLAPAAAPELSAVDPFVARFGEWLRRHRGLSERTITRHVRMVSHSCWHGGIAVFLQLTRSVGLRGGPGEPGPRIHDLRHSFAVRSLEQCGTDRKAVARHMVGLSTYLGHAHVTDTYWYLQASPMLMASIAEAGEALHRGAPS